MASRLLIVGVSGKYRDSDVYSRRRMETERPLIGDYENVVIYLPGFTQSSFEATNIYGTVISAVHKGVS